MIAKIKEIFPVKVGEYIVPPKVISSTKTLIIPPGINANLNGVKIILNKDTSAVIIIAITPPCNQNIFFIY